MDEFGNDEDPTFQIAVINTEDNADYKPPKGVKGEYDQPNEIDQKKLLVLQFNNLPLSIPALHKKPLHTQTRSKKVLCPTIWKCMYMELVLILV